MFSIAKECDKYSFVLLQYNKGILVTHLTAAELTGKSNGIKLCFILMKQAKANFSLINSTLNTFTANEIKTC